VSGEVAKDSGMIWGGKGWVLANSESPNTYLVLRLGLCGGRSLQAPGSHASKFSNTLCCMSHEGEVYFQKQNIT
jgi:hypothetical protein